MAKTKFTWERESNPNPTGGSILIGIALVMCGAAVWYLITHPEQIIALVLKLLVYIIG